jgi:hypothetical protein
MLMSSIHLRLSFSSDPFPSGFPTKILYAFLISPCMLYVRKETNLSLCFNLVPRHEGVLGEWKYNSTHSLTSVLDGGEWSVSRPSRFSPRERAPGTHWVGGWVGPRAVLDVVVKRKIPSPRRESKLRTPSSP